MYRNTSRCIDGTYFVWRTYSACSVWPNYIYLGVLASWHDFCPMSQGSFYNTSPFIARVVWGWNNIANSSLQIKVQNEKPKYEKPGLVFWYPHFYAKDALPTIELEVYSIYTLVWWLLSKLFDLWNQTIFKIMKVIINGKGKPWAESTKMGTTFLLGISEKVMLAIWRKIRHGTGKFSKEIQSAYNIALDMCSYKHNGKYIQLKGHYLQGSSKDFF